MDKKVKYFAISFIVTLLFAVTTVRSYGVETSWRASENMLASKSATAVAPAQWEIKLGLGYTRHIGRPQFDNSWGKTSREKMRLWDWQTTAAYGLTEAMDVFVSTGWFDIKDRERLENLDKHGRGLKDVVVGMTLELQNDVAENIKLAYIPELAIPLGRDAEKNGRLGLGRDFWELNQTLAMTVYTEPLLINTNLSHSIPFGRTRSYYATPYMKYQDNVRGITGATIETLLRVDGRIKPMANLNYSHQWISSGNDSDLITAGIGAKAQLNQDSQIMVGYDYPVAGRNSLRAQTFRVSLVREF